MASGLMVNFMLADVSLLIFPITTQDLLGEITQFTISKSAGSSQFSSKHSLPLEVFRHRISLKKGWSWNDRGKHQHWESWKPRWISQSYSLQPLMIWGLGVSHVDWNSYSAIFITTDPASAPIFQGCPWIRVSFSFDPGMSHFSFSSLEKSWQMWSYPTRKPSNPVSGILICFIF